MRPYFTAPSEKRLVESLGITREQAREIRALLHGEVSPSMYASVREWEDKCYNRPAYRERLMRALCEVIGGGGDNPAIWGRDSVTEPVAEFVNRGDTYIPTLLFDYRADRVRLISMGDFVERYEREYGIGDE